MARHPIALTVLAATLASGATLVGQELQTETLQPRRHAIMHLDSAALKRHAFARANAPRHEGNPQTHYMLAQAKASGATGSVNLLPYLAYTPSTWNQENCGDCWVWGSTAACSIDSGAHGNKTLMSVQWFNSSYNSGTGSSWACCGGDSDTFATWYNSHTKFIPWSNTNASFKDASGACPGTTAQKASGITTTPNIPFTSITNQVITTSGVTQAQAIANIKAVLNNNQAVTFSYFLNGTGWTNFESFWDSSSESTAWSKIDSYNGFSWDSNSGGHEVCCVGYDDSDSTWIILNSWGTTSGRPDGYFKIPQAMGYSDYFMDGSTKYDQYEFETYNIVWPASSNTVSATITTPASNVTLSSGTAQSFVGTGSDSNSSATLTYSWNFGDGSTTTGASASHAYTNTSTSAVNYTATLTVTDNTGATGTATRVITVNSASTPTNTVTATITSPSANTTISTGTAVSFAGSATDSSSTATLSYAWNFGDGSTATGASASHTYTNSGTTAQTYTATFTATDNTGVKGTATRSITVNPASSTSTEQVKNGGFESGTTSWAGTTSVIGAFSAEPAYAGSKCAFMGGKGKTTSQTLYQAVAIPSTATSATLSFYLHIDTAETTTSTAYDKLTVTLQNTSGTTLKTLATYSNLNKATGYAQKTFDVSAYKGQTVRVYFKMSEDSSLKTSFVLDNVSLITK